MTFHEKINALAAAIHNRDVTKDKYGNREIDGLIFEAFRADQFDSNLKEIMESYGPPLSFLPDVMHEKAMETAPSFTSSIDEMYILIKQSLPMLDINLEISNINKRADGKKAYKFVQECVCKIGGDEGYMGESARPAFAMCIALVNAVKANDRRSNQNTSIKDMRGTAEIEDPNAPFYNEYGPD